MPVVMTPAVPPTVLLEILRPVVIVPAVPAAVDVVLTFKPVPIAPLAPAFDVLTFTPAPVPAPIAPVADCTVKPRGIAPPVVWTFMPQVPMATGDTLSDVPGI